MRARRRVYILISRLCQFFIIWSRSMIDRLNSVGTTLILIDDRSANLGKTNNYHENCFLVTIFLTNLAWLQTTIHVYSLCKKIATHYDNTRSTVTKETISVHLLATFKFVSPFSFQWLTTDLLSMKLRLVKWTALWQEKPAICYLLLSVLFPKDFFDW